MAHRTQKIDKNVRILKKEADQTVQCASPIFKPIAYKLSCTNRKRKYFEEKTIAILKIKQTSIATVRNHIRTLACFPTSLPFQYPLPLIKENEEEKRERKDVSLRNSNVRKEQAPKKRVKLRKEKMWVGC